jgi:hypothetical protein
MSDVNFLENNVSNIAYSLLPGRIGLSVQASDKFPKKKNITKYFEIPYMYKSKTKYLIQTTLFSGFENRFDLLNAAEIDEIEYLIEVNPAEDGNPKATHLVWSWNPKEKKWISGIHHFNT